MVYMDQPCMSMCIGECLSEYLLGHPCVSMCIRKDTPEYLLPGLPAPGLDGNRWIK